MRSIRIGLPESLRAGTLPAGSDDVDQMSAALTLATSSPAIGFMTLSNIR